MILSSNQMISIFEFFHVFFIVTRLLFERSRKFTRFILNYVGTNFPCSMAEFYMHADQLILAANDRGFKLIGSIENCSQLFITTAVLLEQCLYQDIFPQSAIQSPQSAIQGTNLMNVVTMAFVQFVCHYSVFCDNFVYLHIHHFLSCTQI